MVIFVTAFEQYAVRAFDVCAQDYLLKPFSQRRFSAALKRGKETVRRGDQVYLSRQVEALLEQVKRLRSPPDGASAPTAAEADSSDRVVIKSDGALHFVSSRDVLWLEAQGDFVKVQARTKAHLVRETLKSFEDRLDPARFLRIHRSFLANIAHVRRVETALYGD